MADGGFVCLLNLYTKNSMLIGFHNFVIPNSSSSISSFLKFYFFRRHILRIFLILKRLSVFQICESQLQALLLSPRVNPFCRTPIT